MSAFTPTDVGAVCAFFTGCEKCRLAAVSAYIDLNPVRAGLCADPKDYRYCGYAEALATDSSLARHGIRTILGQPETISWEEVSRQYRKLLFLKGSNPKR